MEVPMISGRGLAHTGGTLDKLESIPNFQVTNFKQSDMNQMLRDVGCFIIGQSGNLVPADKKLYAVRDITATVNSIPLITSSIMSKKAAESLDALVLDVKCGKAAFMQDFSSSKQLAEKMVNAGSSLGMKMVALITQMDNPIGRAIGNAIEVAESLQCLQGNGDPDLLELVYALGSHLMAASGHVKSIEEGESKLKSVLDDGSALEKFKDMVIAQGVKPSLAQRLVDVDLTDIDNIWSVLDKSENVTDIKTTAGGYVSEIDAISLAVVAKELGAGREEEGAPIDHTVGLRLYVSRGSHIKEGK
ncbi:Thymidine phosphorylase [Apostichopus japonicus]|uniref:Thymidine phosphorylase n=1 Tax=Stichopus japonicus TaxID=307972 RepID=A0A2G8L502_STIJA|nr:Thymidine phosphorylase [Apostichopus japonicus]